MGHIVLFVDGPGSFLHSVMWRDSDGALTMCAGGELERGGGGGMMQMCAAATGECMRDVHLVRSKARWEEHSQSHGQHRPRPQQHPPLAPQRCNAG